MTNDYNDWKNIWYFLFPTLALFDFISYFCTNITNEPTLMAQFKSTGDWYWSEPQKMDWYTANGPDGAAKHTPAVTGYTWRVPAQSEFKQIFKATSGSEENYKNINDMLAVFGDSCKLPWEDEVGTSTPTTYLGMDEYWFVDLYHNVADYALFHATKSHACIIRACFAFW